MHAVDSQRALNTQKNPILQILALSEKHPKIWDGACLEIHLTPFLNNKLGIVWDRREAGAI